MSDNKYFYKLALLMSEWPSSEKQQFLNNISPCIVKTADSLTASEEDQFEEWTGLTDLEGQPFRKRRVDVSNVSQMEPEGMFPMDTLDGDKVSEKGFRRWVRREMKDYINALIENYEWKHGIDGDGLMDYVSRKGWVDFVNKFNPLKLLVNTNKSVKDLSNEFENQTGRTLKREYMNAAKRLVNKKKKSGQPVSVADRYARVAFIQRRMDSLNRIANKK